MDTVKHGAMRNENVANQGERPHPFKHTHAHHANSMEHMAKVHPHKLSVAHPAHPHNEHFKAATENVKVNGKMGTMHIKGV